jgi:hypothetical protein
MNGERMDLATMEGCCTVRKMVAIGGPYRKRRVYGRKAVAISRPARTGRYLYNELRRFGKLAVFMTSIKSVEIGRVFS